MTAAYFALTFCMLAGMLAAFLAFHGEPVPLHFVLKWVGGSWIVSMLVQTVAVLIQYKKGVKENS